MQNTLFLEPQGVLHERLITLRQFKHYLNIIKSERHNCNCFRNVKTPKNALFQKVVYLNN